HLVGGVYARELIGERGAQGQRFGALEDHHLGHCAPHLQEAVFASLSVAVELGDANKWLAESLAVHAHLRGCAWCAREPHVPPLAALGAAHRRGLPAVLPGALSYEPEAIDADLCLALLSPAVAALLPALRGVDLPGERVQAHAVAHAREQTELVVRGATGDGALDELDLLFGELVFLAREVRAADLLNRTHAEILPAFKALTS